MELASGKSNPPEPHHGPASEANDLEMRASECGGGGKRSRRTEEGEKGDPQPVWKNRATIDNKTIWSAPGGLESDGAAACPRKRGHRRNTPDASRSSGGFNAWPRSSCASNFVQSDPMTGEAEPATSGRNIPSWSRPRCADMASSGSRRGRGARPKPHRDPPCSVPVRAIVARSRRLFTANSFAEIGEQQPCGCSPASGSRPHIRTHVSAARRKQPPRRSRDPNRPILRSG